MPLPPALAARLAKRGIIKVKHDQPVSEHVEEVFAEDYDEPDRNVAPSQNTASSQRTRLRDSRAKEDTNGELVHETLACPNRTNIYHTCVDYCKERWGFKKFHHVSTLDEKRKRVLQKYPLPQGWEEVGDPDTGRYYYWNYQTDEVSWLPPSHPKAIITLPAEKLAEVVSRGRLRSVEEENEEEKSDESDNSDIDDVEDENDGKAMDDDDDDIDTGIEDLEKQAINEKKKKEERRYVEERRKEVVLQSRPRQVSKRKRDDLDPMDPASYSDIPRGTWSDGLEHGGTAKTGVDQTASGPLFQQRPYPNPGAILRMNKKFEEKKDD